MVPACERFHALGARVHAGREQAPPAHSGRVWNAGGLRACIRGECERETMHSGRVRATRHALGASASPVRPLPMHSVRMQALHDRPPHTRSKCMRRPTLGANVGPRQPVLMHSVRMRATDHALGPNADANHALGPNANSSRALGADAVPHPTPPPARKNARRPPASAGPRAPISHDGRTARTREVAPQARRQPSPPATDTRPARSSPS